MSLTRTNGASWGVGDKFTSGQANGLDIMITNAIDKRAGQTDTIASLLSMSGAGRIIDTVSNGPDANTTFTADGGNQTIRISGLTAARTYTLSATNAVTGDCIYVYVESSVTFDTMVVDQASNPLFLAGNSAQADGQWASFIYIGGWRLFQGGQGSRFRLTTFTATGQSVTVPRGVTTALLLGSGGGGGGGAGGSFGTYVANRVVSGGGGGGGALLALQIMPVVPGATLQAQQIGAGGAGGSAGAAGNDGVLSYVSDGTTTKYFNGGGGGQAGYFADASANQALLTHGGQPVSFGNIVNTYTLITLATGSPTAGYPSGPQVGGYGITANLGAGKQGNGAPQSIGSGGTGGSNGTTTTSYYGGGGGGGGGNGPFQASAGGVGGAGGNGNSAGTGGAGGAAGAATANAGAGGGGGGAGGMGTGGSGTSGAGGAGGSGMVLVYWVK